MPSSVVQVTRKCDGRHRPRRASRQQWACTESGCPRFEEAMRKRSDAIRFDVRKVNDLLFMESWFDLQLSRIERHL